MAKRSSIDQAISNIMKWSTKPEWASWRDEVFEEHFSPACRNLDMDMDEITREIHEAGYGGMLFGMMFEDFLTRQLGEVNVVDAPVW